MQSCKVIIQHLAEPWRMAEQPAEAAGLCGGISVDHWRLSRCH